MSSTEYDYEIYEKFRQIKTNKRNIVGSVVLGSIVLIGTVQLKALFFFRQTSQLFGGPPNWTILDKFFVPPIQFIIYGLMVMEDPGANVENLCMLGRIFLPIISFLYCAFMLYMSYIHSCVPEFVFYIFLTIVQVILMLPKNSSKGKGTTDWWWWLRPFSKRPEDEVDNERLQIIKDYKLPQQNM